MFTSELLKRFIRFYQIYISFVLNIFIGGNCRFTPSCSEYAYGAIEKYGAIKGGVLSVKRIIRCNPLNSPGYDPVK